MYKYYNELEDRNNFKTYFLRTVLDVKRDVTLSSVPFSEDMLFKLRKLVPKIQIIDKLIMGTREELLGDDYSYDDLLTIGDFFSKKEESYRWLRKDYFDLSNNIFNVYYYLSGLKDFMYGLKIIYPKYNDFLEKSFIDIKDIINDISKKICITLLDLSRNVEVVWPDAWYITKNGYLYNTGLGHKQGNLVYPLYHQIIPSLEKGRKIGRCDYSSKIREIVDRGYVTDYDVHYFSNLIYMLPTVITDDVDNCLMRIREISNLDEPDYKRITSSKNFKWPDTERSYQKNLITLIVGHLDAEMTLYNSFTVLNDASNKESIIEMIKEATNNELEDILVRFSGFSKVSSIAKNTITTSSLNGIRDFSEYLERGWTLEIIPGIVYDRITGEIKVNDFNSPMISRYLDKELDNYSGKGKVLIFNKK